MAGSRWANTAEEAALDAQLKAEKEEKKRLKAEKARKAAEAAELVRRQEEEHAARLQAAEAAQENGESSRPAKRRKLSPEREDDRQRNGHGNAPEGSRKLYRYPERGWGKCRSVEDFEKLNDIEEGAYGWVSRAKDSATGKVVALKRLKMDNANDGIPVTGLREIQTLMACDHENIVKLQEVVVGEDMSKVESIFLVLDFLPHDLRTLLTTLSEPFLLSESKTLLHQLLSGVSYLHARHILHRDLKTSNLLLSHRGILQIADFGMARFVGNPSPNLTQLVVTLWYRSPELLLGAERYGEGVDMWSIGCIFGELLHKEPLLQGKNEVDQLSQIFALCGIPNDAIWPGFRRLPNARSLRLPPSTSPLSHGSILRSKFPLLTTAGSELLNSLLSLDPSKRTSAKEALGHRFFKEEPRIKPRELFPTWPSRAGGEKRRKWTPDAPVRGQKGVQEVDFSGIFGGEREVEGGGGFALKLI